MIRRLAVVMCTLGLLISPLNPPTSVAAAPLAPAYVSHQQANHQGDFAAREILGTTDPAENGTGRLSLVNNAPLQQDTTPPAVLSVEPANGSIDVSVESAISADLSEPILPASFEGGFTLVGPGETSVPSIVSWDAANNRAILTPTVLLATGTVYTATLTGDAEDAAGNTLGADFIWHFTTAQSQARSIWEIENAPPSSVFTEIEDVELGLLFRSTAPGYITHARFYRHVTGGTFVASFWSGDGTLLARKTSPTISTVGWQEVAFDTPVEIVANTDYVISYEVEVGIEFVATLEYFTADVVNPPLIAPGGNDQNGLYEGGGAFPDIPFMNGNWWIDVVYEPLEVDTVAPTIHSRLPEPASINIDPATNVTVRFDEAINAATINQSTFTLRANGAAQNVPATVTYNTTTHSATLNPTSNLAEETVYDVTVANSVADISGNPLGAQSTWQFTTGSPETRATLWLPADGPTGATFQNTVDVEVGLRFQSDVDGQITGVRFYRQSTGGAFTVSLWDGTGVLLASTVSPDVTSVGWQEAHFTAPVPILPDTDYVASLTVPAEYPFSFSNGYFTQEIVSPPLRAPGGNNQNGWYAATAGAFPNVPFGNGNFWIDVVLQPLEEDTVAPTILSRSPAPFATDVAVETNVTVLFSEPMDAATITASTVSLRAAGAAQDVVATLSWNGATRTATLTPAVSLASETLYNVTVAGSVADLNGNPMGSPAVWSFTTRPVSLGITWNMISVSADLGEGATIAEALAPIAGQYALVYAYAGCTDPQNPWRTFNPANPAASDLELHDPMLGYWVFVTQSTHLASEGDPYASLAVDLCAGWNLVGVPYAEPVPVSQATAACSDSVKMVYTFDLAAEGGPWLKHKPGAAISNDFENFEPGKGYWVYSTGACTLGGSE